MSRARRFLAVRCHLGSGCEEVLGEALWDLPTLGCEIVPSGAGSEVCVYFAADRRDLAARLRGRLARAGARRVVEEELEAEDWSRPYRERAVAFAVGKRWWIDPRMAPGGEAPPGRVRLVVEPRMAFGAGTHETTQLVLMELERTPVAGGSVLDVGTGSGILSLAASALGAVPVVGFDIDPVAVFEAARTAAGQDFDVGVHFFSGTLDALDPHRRFGTVLCNMIWERMRPLLGRLVQAMDPRGRMILSGLLKVQEAAVEEELAALGAAPVARRELGEWIATVVEHG